MTKPSVDEVAQGIRLHQKVVEDSLLAAAYAVKNAGGAGSTFHQEQSFDQTLNLGSGKDCCYDSPGIGLVYLLWYHPRRLNETIGRLLPLLLERQEPLHIIDIGCGTAVAASAVLIICAQMKKMNMEVPRVHVRGIDSSPSMLKTGTFVMICLQTSLGQNMPDSVSWSFSTDRWNGVSVNKKEKDVWIHASYLFDSSDKNFIQETAEILAVRAHMVGANKILIATTSSKKSIADAVENSLKKNGFTTEPAGLNKSTFFSGQLRNMREFRKNLYRNTDVSNGLRNAYPLWKSNKDYTVEQSFKLGPGPEKLFVELPSGLVLDLAQHEAAQPENRLTVVQGAAGSGKSTVLAERVARQVKEHSLANRKFEILVTSFNKKMIHQLHEWVNSQVSSVEGYKDEGGEDGNLTIKFKFGSVRFLNFDKIFTRIFKLDTHSPRALSIQSRLAYLRKNNPQLIDQLGNYDDEEFLEAELRRVIYGLDVRSKSDYLKVKRTGRIRGINKQEREAVWDVLMEDGGCGVYTQRRIKVLNHFRKPIADGESFMINGTQPVFSQVFVDECQDMVPADVKIIRGLVADPNHLFFAGDSAQAMHVGIAYTLPSLRGRNWKIVNLESSYRLPQRVVEAIGGIASALKKSDLRHEVVVPEVTKSGVLGIRPIVVAYSNYLVEQLTEILVEYGPMIANCSEITVAESKASSKIFIAAVAAVAAALLVGKTAINEMMAAIKGLERSFVIWSTREVWDSDETVIEFVYTVLTRSTGITVIVIEEDTAIEVAECLKLLRPDRLLFWDSAAESAFDKLNE